MMIEGSGSIPLTSGSGWLKNTWIRIRIRNTAFLSISFSSMISSSPERKVVHHLETADDKEMGPEVGQPGPELLQAGHQRVVQVMVHDEPE
jgi:hypothetical protein